MLVVSGPWIMVVKENHDSFPEYTMGMPLPFYKFFFTYVMGPLILTRNTVGGEEASVAHCALFSSAKFLTFRLSKTTWRHVEQKPLSQQTWSGLGPHSICGIKFTNPGVIITSQSILCHTEEVILNLFTWEYSTGFSGSVLQKSSFNSWYHFLMFAARLCFWKSLQMWK